MSQLPQNPDFPKLEEEIMEFWRKNHIVEQYLSKNANAKKQFSFLDGPITANNPMGVHHGWGRTYKDIWQRFYTLLGYKQRYQNGFDAQGLWVEVEVEKALGFKTKKDIEEYGIDKFVEKCKQRVRKYAAIQTDESQRLGYFMDWDHSYFTMSDENNYSIWHFLKKCHAKNLIYKGFDCVPWCPRCGTAISQHEILTEGYQELTHSSLYIKYPIVGQKNLFFLVWTTTPWTLPGNVAIAVSKDIEYVLATLGGEHFILAKEQVKAIPNFTPSRVKSLGTGVNLTGYQYVGLFDELPRVREAINNQQHKVVLADFVTLEEGTGLVHIAPGAGQEDYALAKEQNLPIIDLIEENASYKNGLSDLTGRNAAQNPQIIIDELHKKGALQAILPYTHRYPTCWRCQSELVFRLVDEWYIKMDPIRDDMMAIAKQINWLPAWGLDRELDWLKNMHDWLISKKRYWGLALPIYPCQDCGKFWVIGSKDELQAKAVEGWLDFEGHSPHRPWVDAVKIKCDDCGRPISRITDVGNPWLDAGIVPFSTITDPDQRGVSFFDDPNKTYWRQWFPADLITESFPGQFRNWFYSLLAMSTVLANQPPVRTILGHGLVKDEQGQEMHKSKGNAIEFNEAASKIGADTMRWLYASARPESNVLFGYSIADEARRRFVLILWHSVQFYLTHALVNHFRPDSDQFQPSPTILDQWIITRFVSVLDQVTDALKQYDCALPANLLEQFIVDDLSQWYIRRSRKRSDRDFDATLYSVLMQTLRVLAPFMPFITEYLYRKLRLKSMVTSIHLNDWPMLDRQLENDQLGEQMSLTREVVARALSARSAKSIKIRQPLANLTVNSPVKLDDQLIGLIADEVNVKTVKVFVKPALANPEVRLDTQLTVGLIEEGLVREVSRTIQQIRKQAGWSVGDQVDIYWSSTDQHLIKVVEKQKGQLEQNLTIKLIKKDLTHQTDKNLTTLNLGQSIFGAGLNQS